jgi:SAM-dependent methyltransferase
VPDLLSGRLLSWLRRNPSSTLSYWEQRAARFGRRAVLNLSHAEEELGAVTDFQKREIYPCFRQLLRGDEQVVLDFGCGPGRFTGDLAELIAGSAIGVDPIRRFLELAPKHNHVEYRTITAGTLPLPDMSVDVIWVCLVLGGIVDPLLLDRTVAELERVLKSGGLLFVVENTAEQPAASYWVYRSVAEYVRMFPFAQLAHLRDYWDLGERISVMAGRKSS